MAPTATTLIQSPTKGKAKALAPEIEDGFERVLSREEKRKQRKVDKHTPQFQFDTGYFRMGKKIGIAHVRDLILNIIADGQKPGWIIPEHKSLITHTVLLLIPGLLPEHLGLPPVPITSNLPFSTTPTTSASSSKVPAIGQLFSYGLPTRAPGDQRRMFSVLGTLLQSPLPDSVRRKREEEVRKLAALAKSDASSPLVYLLTPNQMVDNDYILPSYVKPSDTAFIPGMDYTRLPADLAEVLRKAGEVGGDGELGVPPDYAVNPLRDNGKGKGKAEEETWVETKQAEDMPENGLYQVLAMDCEMVVTEDGQELARVSVIDFQSGINIFDELVKPPKPVLDYRTQWSGITPEKLLKATHTLSSIQTALLEIITPHTILLGHSLECDLTALRIRHPLCIDTAILYRHPRGPPYKPGLKWLTQKWLGREIQASEGGHDSEEDARACVDLLKLKMANGPDFGSMADTTEPIFSRLTRYTNDSAKTGKTSVVCDNGNPKNGLGSKATKFVRCSTDEEVLQGMVENVGEYDFTFGRFNELAVEQGWYTDSKSSTITTTTTENTTDGNGIEDSPTPSSSPSPDHTLELALSNLNKHLIALHAALPPSSALILVTGQSDPRPMMSLIAKRQRWERLVKTTMGGSGDLRTGRGNGNGNGGEVVWLSGDDRELEKRVAEAREGMAFFCVKGKGKEVGE